MLGGGEMGSPARGACTGLGLGLSSGLRSCVCVFVCLCGWGGLTKHAVCGMRR